MSKLENFLSNDKRDLYIKGGAKNVILSVPPKENGPIYVVGVKNKMVKPVEGALPKEGKQTEVF